MKKTETLTRDTLRNFYRAADKYSDRQDAHPDGAYREYLDFISRFVPAASRILDLGCATGTSSCLLAGKGYVVTGSDISAASMNKAGEKRTPGLDFTCADISRLPFKGESFDCAALFLVIEHIPDVPALLEEMARVIKIKGKIIILSPNLLSPFNVILPLVDSALGKRANFLFGVNNLSGIINLAVRNTFSLLKKMFSAQANFSYRVPVLENRFDFIADNDAVYLACPLDFKRYFEKKENMRIINYQGYGRAGRVLPDFSTGIYFAVEKLRK